jgi:hypothetical protein
MGRLADAASELDRAIKLAREHSDVENLGWAHTNRAYLGWLTGDRSGARWQAPSATRPLATVSCARLTASSPR